MSWWSRRRYSRRRREQRELSHSQQLSESLCQEQSQQRVPNITIGDEAALPEHLEQRRPPQSHKKVYHRPSTTSTESEGYGSRDASTSSLPQTRTSLSSLQSIPEESRHGIIEASPISLHKNVSTASVGSESSTASSYHTARRHSPVTYLEQLPADEHSLKTRFEKCHQNNKDERGGLERRIAELDNQYGKFEKYRQEDKRERSELEGRIAELEDQLEKLEKCRQEDKEERVVLKGRIAELENQLEKFEKYRQEDKEERVVLEGRIAELEDLVKTLASTQHVVCYTDCGENDNKNTLPANVPVSKDVIIALAKRISRWKFLARYLGFQEHDIQRIHDEHQSDVQEQCFQMLWRWKQTHPSGGDYLTLGEAVKKDLGDSFYFDFVELVTESEKGSQCTSLC